MAAIEVSQSSFTSSGERAQPEANNNPAQNQYWEQIIAELKNENEQLKLALKQKTEEHERTKKDFAAMVALMKEWKRKCEGRQKDLHEQYIYLSTEIIQHVNEKKALEERNQFLEELIQGGLNGQIQTHQSHRSISRRSKSASQPEENDPQRRVPKLEELDFDEYVHPENEEQDQNDLTTREEHAYQTSEEHRTCEIFKALKRKAQRVLSGNGGTHVHLLKIVHTCDSVTFIDPDIFHLSFRKQGGGCIIQPKDEGLMEVISKTPLIQLVEVFLKMLFSDSERSISFLILEMEEINHQQKIFLRSLEKVLEARDKLLRVHHLYTPKLLLSKIVKYVDSNKCESITVLKNGGEGGEELDDELLRSQNWKKLKRFCSFDEFPSQKILEQSDHIPDVHVILKDKMEIEEILEFKQKLLQTPHLAHVSIYFKLRIRYSFMKTLFASLKQPFPVELKPKRIYFCCLDEKSQLRMKIDRYGIEFQGAGNMGHKLKDSLTRRFFEDVIEKRESEFLIPYIMDQRDEENYKMLDEFVKERQLKFTDSDLEYVSRALTASSDEEETSPDRDMSESQESNSEVGSELESEIDEPTALDMDSADVEVSGLRGSEADHCAALNVVAQNDSSKKRLGGPMEEQSSTKILKIAEEEPVLEQSHYVPYEGLSDAPENVSQRLDPVNTAPNGIEQNEDTLGAKQHQDYQQTTHDLPSGNVCEMLQNLQSVMDRSSDEYRMGCRAVLMAAVSRFSGPNPPKTASEFLDEMIRRFQTSSIGSS